MKRLQNLKKIFMVLGIVSAVLGLMLDIVNWIWPVSNILWILNAYVSDKRAEDYETLIENKLNKF